MGALAKSQKANRNTINLRELYEEKRAYPRITLDTLTTISNKDEYKISGVLHDISPDGVQIRVDGKSARTIHPSGKQITTKTQPEVKLKFYLAIDDKNKEVNARVKLFYISIVDLDVVAFGGKFLRFENMTERHVKRFISDSVVPVEEKVVKMLNQPMTGEDIKKKLDEDIVDLDDTLNLLRKKLFPLLKKTRRSL